MRQLIIKNIGPIEEINIELKRINVLIGLQSSGKSTINKIACYCSWVEKEIATTQSAEYFKKEGVFESHLVVFHKLGGFVHDNSFIQYETDVMRFSYSKKEDCFRFEWKNQWEYVRPKMIYIPAERNIVGVIPNWFEVKLEENNIRSFMGDWEEARTYYGGQQLDMLSLGVRYAFDPLSRKDRVFLSNDKPIDFTNTSSGLQSLIPLMVVLRYVTDGIFKMERKDSVHDVFWKKTMKERIHEAFSSDEERAQQLLRITEYILTPHYTNIFLEEPEQNLFPFTQRDLVKYLIALINKEREHHLFITTHSPYILTSLNNLLYTGKVGKVKGEAVKQITPTDYWVDFSEIGAWFVQDGQVSSILDMEEELIQSEAIDEVSHELNRDFDELMKLELNDVD